MPEIVVLGIGNILLGDEGVGVHVLKELEHTCSFPANVKLVDGGTSGFDLLPFLEDAQHLVVIDSVNAGETPGELFRIVPKGGPCVLPVPISSHEIGLLEILEFAKWRGKCPRTTILGIQISAIHRGLDLTPTVKAKLPKLVDLVIEELQSLGVEVSRHPSGE